MASQGWWKGSINSPSVFSSPHSRYDRRVTFQIFHFLPYFLLPNYLFYYLSSSLSLHPFLFVTIFRTNTYICQCIRSSTHVHTHTYIHILIFRFPFPLPYFFHSSIFLLCLSLQQLLHFSLLQKSSHVLLIFILIFSCLFLHFHANFILFFFMPTFFSFLLKLFHFLFPFQGSVLASKFTEEALNIGLAAFGVGEAGNFFHHLFSSSGKNSNSKKVDKSLPFSTSSNHPVVIKDVHSLWKKMKGKIPEVKKVLDKLTNHPVVPVKLHDALTPNYLFELITWFGIACLSQHWNVYLVLTAVIAKAVVKAKSTSTSS